MSILHNDSLKLTGGQYSKGNAFRKLIAIGGGDLGQRVVTGRQFFNVVGLVLGNPLCNRVAVLILDDQLCAGQLFICGNVNLGDLKRYVELNIRLVMRRKKLC